MPTNHTPNYNLNQWERDDRILMDDFNTDNAKIDAALKAGADARAALAETAAAHAAEIAKRGNCQIETFSYTGTGDSSKTITFRAMPVFYTIVSSTASAMGFGGAQVSFYMGWRSSGPNGGSYVSVSGMNVSWKGTTMAFGSAELAERMNWKDVYYQVAAFYAMDKT